MFQGEAKSCALPVIGVMETIHLMRTNKNKTMIMELKNLYLQMLKNGIEELRVEKYQQERNGQAEALQITLDNIIELVNKTDGIHGVVGRSEQLDCECGNPSHCVEGNTNKCWDCGNPVKAN